MAACSSCRRPALLQWLPLLPLLLVALAAPVPTQAQLQLSFQELQLLGPQPWAWSVQVAAPQTVPVAVGRRPELAYTVNFSRAPTTNASTITGQLFVAYFYGISTLPPAAITFTPAAGPPLMTACGNWTSGYFSAGDGRDLRGSRCVFVITGARPGPGVLRADVRYRNGTSYSVDVNATVPAAGKTDACAVYYIAHSDGYSSDDDSADGPRSGAGAGNASAATVRAASSSVAPVFGSAKGGSGATAATRVCAPTRLSFVVSYPPLPAAAECTRYHNNYGLRVCAPASLAAGLYSEADFRQLVLEARETLYEGWHGCGDLVLRTDRREIINVMAPANARMRKQAAQLEAVQARSAAMQAAYVAARANGSCADVPNTLCGVLKLDTIVWGLLTDIDREALTMATAPPAYDARVDAGAYNPVPPLRGQGNCNASVGFVMADAAEAAIASKLRRSAQQTRWTPSLSPQALFFCHADGSASGATCDRGLGAAGTNFGYALFGLTVRRAIPASACAPWAAAAPGGAASPPPSCSVRCNATSTPGEFTLERLVSYAAIQHHIREWGGVATLMHTPAALLRWLGGPEAAAGGVYDAPDPPGAALAAAPQQAVFVVGYNNTERAWTVQASWAPAAGRGSASAGRVFKVRYGRLHLLDPAATFGITFKPSNAAAAPGPAFLNITAEQRPGDKPLTCAAYVTRAGDYVGKVLAAFTTESVQGSDIVVGGDSFFALNAAEFPTTLDAFLVPGQRLRLCKQPTVLPLAAAATKASDTAAALRVRAAAEQGRTSLTAARGGGGCRSRVAGGPC